MLIETTDVNAEDSILPASTKPAAAHSANSIRVCKPIVHEVELVLDYLVRPGFHCETNASLACNKLGVCESHDHLATVSPSVRYL